MRNTNTAAKVGAQAQHTPGPWTARDSYGRPFVSAPNPENPDSSEVTIADCSGALPAMYMHQGQANARLIASAPELAAQRDELRAKFEIINRITSPGNRTLDEMVRDMGFANDKARAAIKRAEKGAQLWVLRSVYYGFYGPPEN